VTDRDEHSAPETSSAVDPSADQGTPQVTSVPAGRILDAEVLSTESTSSDAAGLSDDVSLAVPAGPNQIPAAGEQTSGQSRYTHPLRFGLKALIALTAVCAVQFALMFYVGTLTGLIFTALLCAGMLVALLLASFVIPQQAYQPWAGRFDQFAIRLVLAIVLLLIGAAFSGGGILMYNHVQSLRLTYRIKSDLGFSAKVDRIWDKNPAGSDAIRTAIVVTSVRTGSPFHQAGFEEDDVILTDLTPQEYYEMLEENRGSTITVTVARDAMGPVMTPIEKCPQRSLVLEIPE
jgi:hypothetical protein